jgi:hypothetical protein
MDPVFPDKEILVEVPELIVELVAVAVPPTEGELTVVVMVLEVAGEPVAQVAFEVNVTVT